MRRLVLLAILLLYTLPALGHPYPRQLTCKSTVYEPFVIDQEANGIHGIDVDVVREMGRRLNIKIKIALMPWRRLEQRLKAGKENCVFAYFDTPERHAYAQYMTIPLHVTRYVLFGRPALAQRIHRVADLKGLRIGVNRGFKLPSNLAAADKSGRFQLTEVSDDAISFRMLGLERIDLVLTNSDVGDYVSQQVLNIRLKKVEPPLTIRPAYLVLGKKPGLTPLLHRFDETLSQMLRDGTYQRICQRYLSDCARRPNDKDRALLITP